MDIRWSSGACWVRIEEKDRLRFNQTHSQQVQLQLYDQEGGNSVRINVDRTKLLGFAKEIVAELAESLPVFSPVPGPRTPVHDL